jgi:hypothetical protein
MKQDSVSNESVTLACHMCTYALTYEHQKLNEIERQHAFLGIVTTQ